ncbi:MAG: asparagine synthase C-terminal domain-containing protein [Ignavibacteriales bacterium]|nr:asparagine synthase C-terminal domain-containing protein [Ignavibacteriales bacterium]
MNSGHLESDSKNKNYDEGSYQSEMVDYLGVNHSEIVISNDDIGTNLEDVLWHTEKPLLRTGPIPLYLLSKLVNQSGYKVVLTGEGADEIFGGYDIFKAKQK